MRGRSVLFGLALAALLLELAGLGIYRVRHGGWFYARPRADEPVATAEPAPESKVVLHPYLGFINRPGLPLARIADATRMARLLEGAVEPPDWSTLAANNHGFFSPHDYPYLKRSEEELVVAIFGGSVAQWLALQSADVLADRLGRQPAFAGRRIVVLNFAQGGFKQPQQLQALTYFLALGQRFDLVLNVDGFNELALGRINQANRIDTAMPSAQHVVPLLHRIGATETTAETDAPLCRAWRAERSLRRREGWRAANPSAGVNLLLEPLVSRAERARVAALVGLEALPERNATSEFVELAALPADFDPARSFEAAWEPWLRASRTMQDACASAGASYLEIVQPNQYAGDRTFTDRERRLAINPRSPYRVAVEQGYARLGDALEEARAEGLSIESAIELFDRIALPVYSDDCCHYNQIGNELLAEFIVDRLAAGGAAGRP